VQRALALGMSPEHLRELAWRLQDFRDLLDANSTWPTPSADDPLDGVRACGTRLLELCAGTDVALDVDDRLVYELRRLQPLAERLASVCVEDDAMRLLRQCDPRQVGSAGNWPAGHCAAIKAGLKECSQRAAAILEAQRDIALADLLQHLRDFTLDCADQRRHEGQANFHDLLTWARDLLRDNSGVRRRAQARFDRIFVDEFQDTDPLQVEIAWLLAADPAQAEETDWTQLRLVPGKLFVVGDPKQSIYRFRRADIGVYQHVYELLENASNRVVLSQSFRSPEPLVDWFNHHFARDMQYIHGAQPAYTPLDPRPGTAAPPAENDFGVRCFGTRIDAAGERWQAEAEAVARMADRIVRGGSGWRVSDRGSAGTRVARFSDICVLLPSRTNLRRLERAFQQLSVPYRVESGWLVLQTQEVRDLVSCLRAIDDPSDQVALVAALRSPAYGCSDVELLHWVDAGGRFDYERPGRAPDGRVKESLVSLSNFHTDRLKHSPAELTEVFIRERMLAVQAFGTAQPRDAIRRLRYVVAQARVLASSGQTTLRQLCDWLETRQREQYYDIESTVPDSDEDAVRFMTVHGSKGLEFPVVILTGLSVATSRAGPQSVDLVPNYATGVLEVRCGDFATLGYARETEQALYVAEQKRLLYVGTTRARDHLVLSLYCGKDDSHAVRIRQHLAERPDLAREVVLDPSTASAVTLPTPTTSMQPPAGSGVDPGSAAARHRADEVAFVTHRDQVITSLARQAVIAPSSLGHAEDAEPSDAPPEPDANNVVRRLRRGRRGSAIGLAVHAVLQAIDLATLDHLDALCSAAARDEGVADQVSLIRRYVRDAARSDPVQRAVASGRYWREVPVGVARDDGAIVEGVIDLLHEQPDGKLIIVDYKTDRVIGADFATRADSYRAQALAYAAAVAQATGREVIRVLLVFAALGGRVHEIQRVETSMPSI
jgi:ATP-dependent exoDNAse (exonuclease V) beta subunit